MTNKDYLAGERFDSLDYFKDFVEYVEKLIVTKDCAEGRYIDSM